MQKEAKMLIFDRYGYNYSDDNVIRSFHVRVSSVVFLSFVS